MRAFVFGSVHALFHLFFDSFDHVFRDAGVEVQSEIENVLSVHVAERLLNVLVEHEEDVDHYFDEAVSHFSLSLFEVLLVSLELSHFPFESGEAGKTVDELAHLGLVDFALLRVSLLLLAVCSHFSHSR